MAPDPSAERTPSGWSRRSYAGIARWLTAIAAADGASLLSREGLLASIAPAAAERSLFNSVVYDEPGALERHLGELALVYEDAGVLAWTVWVPDADREGAVLLAERGHSLDGAPREMLVALDEPDPPPDGLGVAYPGEWASVCGINDEAYGLPAGSYERGAGAVPAPGWQPYLALHEGRPACALATLDAGDDCFVSMVATVPAARGRGLASGLLLRALADARERGCVTSTLQASARGAPVYSRLGYRDVGGLEMWERRGTGA